MHPSAWSIQQTCRDSLHRSYVTCFSLKNAICIQRSWYWSCMRSITFTKDWALFSLWHDTMAFSTLAAFDDTHWTPHKVITESVLGRCRANKKEKGSPLMVETRMYRSRSTHSNTLSRVRQNPLRRILDCRLDLTHPKLGKQNARWILNKSLLPYREPHPDNCTMFEHAKYDSWSGSSKVGSTGSTSARPFWVEDINSAKDFARGLWQFSLTMAMVISRMFPSQLHLHGTTMYYTCTGWGKATSKSLNYSWFRPDANGRLRKWSCYCCTWLQVITNRNGWQGGCQW